MIGIVFQDPVPKTKRKLYRKPPPPRTVFVPKKEVMDLLLTEERARIMNESWQVQAIDEKLPPDQIPTVFWGIAVRSQDFVPTIYPHHLRPLSEAEITLNTENSKRGKPATKSDEETLREQLRRNLLNEGVDQATVVERLKDIRNWGYEIPPEIVSYYNLRNGYEVELKVIKDPDPKNLNQQLLVITRVNGLDDPDAIRNLPLPIGIRERGVRTLRKSYPRKMIELDKFGSVAMRMFYLLGAALGHGNVIYLRGEGGLGKTGISLEAWKATLRLTLEEPKSGEKPVFAFLDFVGERDEDLDDLYRRAMEETPHNPNRVEVVFATKSDDPLHQWQVFEYAIARIRVLGLFYNLVAFHDSGPRAVEAISDVVGGDKPLVSGGVVKEAITDVGRYVGSGGYFPETKTSITQIVLTLDGDPKDPATMLDRLTKDHNTTGLWSLNRNAPEWPPIDVLERVTYVRRKELHINPLLAAESEFVLQIARKLHNGRDGQTAPPEVVLQRIRDYVEQVPLPAYVTGKEFKIEAQQSLWERRIGLAEQYRMPLPDFNSLAYELFIGALSRQDVSKRKLAFLNEKGEPIELVTLPNGGPGSKLEFVGSDDKRFAQILGS